MKTKKIYRILEGAFLFTLILMIYILSIFSAQGQMTKELAAPHELILFDSQERNGEQNRITQNIQSLNSKHTFNRTIENDEFQYIPNYLSPVSDSNQIKITLPKSDLRRRKMEEYQAPLFRIPIN